MAEKKKDSDFKVSDRRLFTADGDLRSTSDDETAEATQPAGQHERPSRATTAEAKIAETKAPEATTVAQTDPTRRRHRALPSNRRSTMPIAKSARDLDRRVELSGHSSKDLEVNFERFMASLYMTAMMHLA